MDDWSRGENIKWVTGEQRGESEWVTWSQREGRKRAVRVIEMFEFYLSYNNACMQSHRAEVSGR